MSAAPPPFLLDTGPPRGVRLIYYALFWLMPLGLLLYFGPRFDPILLKLEEKVELSVVTTCLLTLIRYDAQSYHVLSFLAVVEITALDEAVFQLRRQFAPHLALARMWVAFVLLGTLSIFGMIVYAVWEINDKLTCRLPG
jgi:hypothetical protein